MIVERDETTQPPCANPVEMRPIDRLKPHPENARTHSEEQIAQLARSIETFGTVRSVLVDENGVTLAGHGVVMAYHLLNRTMVPVTVVSHLTEQQKRLYVIADNQLALNSEWDYEKRAEIVAQLEKELADVKVTGISPQEQDRLADLSPEQHWVDEDHVPNAPTLVVSTPGDLWGLKGHLVVCGSALSGEDLHRALGGEVADMVFTDPPYNVSYRQKRKRQPIGGSTIANDNLGEGFEQFLYAAIVEILARCRGGVYICMSSSELHTLYKAFTEAGGHWSTFLIWAKDRFTLGRSDFQRQYEPILYGWREGQEHFWRGARNEGDVWFVPKPKANRLHPTMKPVSLIERALRNSSQRGDLVLDPFGGSGSTLIACEKTGRRAAIVEVEPKYVDVIVRRWEAYTHLEARLENDGRTFAEVSQERLQLAA
jgi:DNA modification methylase